MYHDKDFDPPAGSYRLRCSERRRLSLEAALSRHDCPNLPVVIKDLSAAGFAATCETPLAIGTRFWLQLAGHNEIAAEVKWRRGRFIGCEFEHGLSLRTVLSILVKAS
ncbi:MAG TPA: hypothetical protein VGD19_01635 [Allosphingosinicella sp.]|jgi:hypothetical protein